MLAVLAYRTQDHNHFGIMGARIVIAYRRRFCFAFLKTYGKELAQLS